MSYRLSTNTYSQSSRYTTSNEYATSANMNDFSCDSGTATASANPTWVSTDLGAAMFVEYIIIGYDRNNVIPGGWGVNYSISGPNVGTSTLYSSNDGSTWTSVVDLPSYTAAGSPSNGLKSVVINTSCRYLKIQTPSYFALTEFEVWVNPTGGFFQMF